MRWPARSSVSWALTAIALSSSLARGITFKTPYEALHGQSAGIKLHQFLLNGFNIARGDVFDTRRSAHSSMSTRSTNIGQPPIYDQRTYPPFGGIARPDPSLLQDGGNLVRVVGHHRGPIAEAGMNRCSAGSLEFSGVVPEDIIRIL